MKKKTALLSSVSVKILLFMLAGVTGILAIFPYINNVAVQSIYHSFFSDKTLLVNRIVAAQINARDLEPYISAMRRDEAFKKEQLAFFNTRQRLFELEKTPPSENIEEKKRLWDEIRLFYKKNDRFKDAHYMFLEEQLEKLRLAVGARYLYIFADTGLPGFFTYVFDAHAVGMEERNLSLDDIGTINSTEYFEMAEDVFRSGEQIEKPYYDIDANFGEVYFSYSPLFDEDGNVAAVIGTDVDLSDMHTQINTLRARQMKAVSLGGGLFILVFYLLLRFIIVNPITALTETAANIAEGNVYTNPPAWLLERKDELGRLGRALSSMTKVFQTLLTDAKRIFEAAIEGRFDARSDPSAFAGDIALFVRKINDAFDTIVLYFDSLPEVFFILDSRLELAFRNRQYIHLFEHMPPAEIVRRILGEPGSENGGMPEHALARKWNETLSTGVYTTSVWLPLSDGTENCFTFTCRCLVLNGVRRGTVVAAGDVTDLMREKVRAQSASRAKGEFLSRVSHELRSPMNIIIGMAKLGLKDRPASSPPRERFQSIVSASDHLLRVINDVLDMSRIESGKIEIHYAQFNLRKMVDDCACLLRTQIEGKRIDFVVSIASDVPSRVVGDSARVSQILINLLTNSYKFTEEGGRISLSLTPGDSEDDRLLVAFSVEDTGIGMSNAFMEKIFTPFEQEAQYLQRKYQGTGLGLSICHRLVGLMGGSFQVSSQLGVGSKFTFTLPFLPGTEEGEPLNADEAVVCDFSRVRLLLADDIEINREILKESLADTQISITEAGDGEEALNIFKNSEEGTFDLILMDVQMPRMDGYRATEAIRALPRADAGLPIVAMTANAMKEDVEQSLAHGMSGHISKPVDIDTCIREIARAVNSKTP